MNSNRNFRYIIITSILLHILFLGALGLGVQFGWFEDEELENIVADKPLVFELEDRNRSHEIVETPDDAAVDKAPEDAELASDKNAVARNEESDPNLEFDEPFARGDFDFKELPTNQAPVGAPITQPENNQESQETELDEKEMSEEADIYASNETSAFRQYLLDPDSNRPGASETTPRVRHDNQAARTEEMGSFTFNTYDWNFAPYMLALKKRIGSNIFPPPAFTRLGMIDGETLTRFRIYPSGEMTMLSVLEYKGHHTLMETSVRAVEVSDPFPELPDDFPEAYLEVTANFKYFITRPNNHKRREAH